MIKRGQAFGKVKLQGAAACSPLPSRSPPSADCPHPISHLFFLTAVCKLTQVPPNVFALCYLPQHLPKYIPKNQDTLQLQNSSGTWMPGQSGDVGVTGNHDRPFQGYRW